MSRYLRGVEASGERLDELLGDRQLAVVDLEVVGQVVEALGVDDLVGEDHRRHPEHVAVHRAQGDELLLRRITTLAMPTLLVSRIASSSSL